MWNFERYIPKLLIYKTHTFCTTLRWLSTIPHRVFAVVLFGTGIRIAQPQPWRATARTASAVGLLNAVFFYNVSPPFSCRQGPVLFSSVLRLFRLVFLGSLSDGLGFDSCSLCDFTACVGMSLPSACSFQLVFGLLSSRRLYTSCMLYMLFIFGGNRCLFTAQLGGSQTTNQHDFTR